MQDQQRGDSTATMEVGEARAVIRHLGLLVVYHLKDDDDLPLLRLHLERIQHHTHVPYTLFAVANRVSPTARAMITAQPNVVLCDITPTEARGSREHGYYLDAMLPIALASGVSHLCTLDVDSFPIDDRWLDVLLAKAPPSGVVGVLRAENGDVALAHPSCILAPRSLFQDHRISFSPDPEDTREFRRFARATGQAPDTGVRLAATLWASGDDWGRLLRSNAVNPHYLIAGIYDDVLFHLGGVSRGIVFRADRQQSRRHQLTRPIERVPVRGKVLGGIKQKTLSRVRSAHEQQLARQNREVHTQLREWLFEDPDGLFAFLRGEAPARPGFGAGRVATAMATIAAPLRPADQPRSSRNGHVGPVGADALVGADARADERYAEDAPAVPARTASGVPYFPMPVVPDAPPRELRYHRAFEVGTALRALWDSLGIIWALVVRQVRAQYSQQVLGLAWAIFTPFAQTVVFTLLLNKVANKSTLSTENVPRALFLYAGLTAWSFVSSAVASGGTSLVGNPLLNKVYAPREVFPVAQVASSLLNTIAALMVFPLLMAIFDYGPAATAFWSVILGVVLIVFTTAVALFVAATTVYMRDLRSGLPLVLQLGMFFPGVLYAVSGVFTGFAAAVYALVFPAGTLIDQMRETLFHNTAPDASVTLLATLGTVLYLVGGFLYFKRLETGFADVS